jgi:hypothetical protein
MMDDLKDVCKSQLKRLAHLDGFPKHSEAIADYLSALAVAKSADRVQRVVGAFTGDSELTRCPTAAQIRKIAYDLLEAEVQQQRGCEACGGSGYVTIYKLVTYHGKSMQMKYSEPVPESEWRALAEKIAVDPLGADRQQVLSAAKECACRKRVVA